MMDGKTLCEIGFQEFIALRAQSLGVSLSEYRSKMQGMIKLRSFAFWLKIPRNTDFPTNKGEIWFAAGEENLNEFERAG